LLYWLDHPGVNFCAFVLYFGWGCKDRLMPVYFTEMFDRLAPRARGVAVRQNARPSGLGGFTKKQVK